MDFAQLRRWPDVDGPGLQASDAADRLILDEAAAALAATTADRVVVIDDAFGALALSAAELCGRGIRSHQDLITGERALAANAHRLGLADAVSSLRLAPELLANAEVVLLRLPRSLDRLDEVAGLIAAHAAPGVAVYAGARLKHMTLAMNEVLAAWFARVDVTLARQKSRVLIARSPLAVSPATTTAWPRTERHADLGLTLAAHGGVFAGTRVDIGTRLLLAHLSEAVPDAEVVVDLACGNGIVGAALAAARPHASVISTDRSAAAVAAARATAALNGVADRMRVTQADGLELLANASERLVVLNPPFHSDASISIEIARHLFADAARALAPGGELWCVWNSHLRYRSTLESVVGPTRQIARTPKFTLTASTRRG
ncbi:MAG TPA: methyltransferase [Candidatus Lumbricidophila sp.]|nr:methyltransferase [Candidatus Lumbricidophila sp.]